MSPVFMLKKVAVLAFLMLMSTEPSHASSILQGEQWEENERGKEGELIKGEEEEEEEEE